MRDRLIGALTSPNVEKYLTDPVNFPLILRGGYEDNLTMRVFLEGFKDNSDLIAQYSLGLRNCADIACLKDGILTSIIEFGHQFSLQFQYNPNTGLAKLKSEASKRIKPLTANADLYTVHIITDVIEYKGKPTSWSACYSIRYNIPHSMKKRSEAERMINEIVSTINLFNSKLHPAIPPGDHITIRIRNSYGAINVHFIVNGPYSFNHRTFISEHKSLAHATGYSF